jgi:hypothetical protein
MAAIAAMQHNDRRGLTEEKRSEEHGISEK